MDKSVEIGDGSASFLGIVFAIIKQLSLERFGTLEFIF